MSTELDRKVADFLPDLVSRVGKVLTFKVTTGGTLNKLTGETTGEVTTSYSVTCTPPSSPKNSSSFARELGGIDGSVVGVSEFLVPNTSTLAFIPKPGQVVTINDEDWFVEAVHPVISGEDIAAFRVLVKR